MTESILDNIKKPLGIDASYTAFDQDVIMHINSAINTLHDIGIGPPEGFEITDNSSVWSELLGDNIRYNSAKTYIYMRVRLAFDPPGTSFAQDALKEQIAELEQRLSMRREMTDYTDPVER